MNNTDYKKNAKFLDVSNLFNFIKFIKIILTIKLQNCSNSKSNFGVKIHSVWPSVENYKNNLYVALEDSRKKIKPSFKANCKNDIDF